jgi:hypothetical protein
MPFFFQTVLYVNKELVTLTKNNIVSLYLLAECYYLEEDYPKVVSLFNKHRILTYGLDF